MSAYTDLLRQFANLGSPTVPEQVPAKAPAPTPPISDDTFYKAAAAQAQGTGTSIQDPITQDLVNLTGSELIAKYGYEQGLSMLQQRTMGDNRFKNDVNTVSRNPRWDTVTGAGKGLANSIGGLGSLAVGLVNDDAGAWAAGQMGDFNEWASSKQSDSLNIHRRSQAVINALSAEDNKARYENERLTDGDFAAGLRRVGRDVLDIGANAWNDGAILGDLVSEGVGSLLAGGLLSKAAKVSGLANVTGRATMPGIIGGMESGGAYQQTTNQVMGMSHADLMISSPDYRDLVSKGWKPEDAKTEIATSAGLLAAAVTAPTAIAAGKLVAPFEAAPFATGSLRKLGTNALKETVEEGIQGGSGQLAQNFGVKSFADENQDLGAGVGDAIGTGALAGSLSTGAIGAPGVALNAGKTAVSGAVAAGRAGMGAISDRLANIRSTTAAESPVDPTKLNAAAEEIIATAPQTMSQVDAFVADGSLTPEQGATVKERLDKLNTTISFKPEDLGPNDLTPDVAAHIGSATNKFDALSRAAGVAGSTDASPQDRIGAAIFINDTLANHEANLIEQTGSALDPLPDNHPITDMLWGYQDTLVNIHSNPEIQQARKVAQDYVARLKAADITEESLATPKGQQAVKGILSVAQSDPESVNPDLADLVLKHARKGLVKLTRQQSNTLTSASLINRVGNTYTIKSKKLKLPAKMMNIVSREILENDVNENALSAAGHVRAINLALVGNNIDGAGHQLRLMMGFARHLQNKVGALNKSLAKGNGTAVKFLGVDPKGVERETLNGVYINTKSENSIELAQRIALDAEALGTMANEMALLHPDLGVDPIELAQLDTSVNEAPAKEVVRKFRSGNVAPTTTPAHQSPDPVKDEPKAQAQPSPEVKSENKAPETAPVEQTKPEPAPVKEPKPAEPVVEPVAVVATPEPAETGQPEGGDTSTKAEVDLTKLTDDELNKQIMDMQKRGLSDLSRAERKSYGDLQAEWSRREKEQSGKPEPVAPSPEANLVPPSSTTEAEATDIKAKVGPYGGSVDLVAAQKYLDDPANHNAGAHEWKVGAKARALPAEVQAHVENYMSVLSNALGFDISKYVAGIFTAGALNGAGAFVDQYSHFLVIDQNQIDKLDLSDSRSVYIFDSLLQHELGHILHAHYESLGSPFVYEDEADYERDFPTDFFDGRFHKGGKLYSEFKSLTDKGWLVLPHYSYIESHKLSAFNAEFIAEAFRVMVEGAQDNISEDIPNVAVEITKLIKFFNGTGQIETGPLEGYRLDRLTAADTRAAAGSKEQPIQGEASANEVAVAKPAPKTLQEAFPNLIGQNDGPVRNWFMKAFSLPKTVTSRLLGTASPIQVLKDALASDKTLGEFIGKLTKRSFDDKLVSAYADLMTYADKMSGAMDERLSKFLGSPMSKKVSTLFGEALANGVPGATQVNQYPRGKVLNITETNDNGDVVYNQALKEAAIMAGLQWLISASTDSRTYDAEAASKIYGVDESLIIQTDLDWLNGGPWMTEAKRTIGDKIVQYWGLRGNDNSPVSYTKGIGEGAAAEVLHALKAAGLINLEERLIHNKTMRRITGVDNKAVIEMFNSLKGLPTAIEQAVLVEPDIQHMGTPPVQVPTNQMHGSPVVLAEQQQKAAKAAQDTPYRTNLPMLSFIEMLGLGNILYMFGNGDPEAAGLNKQHAASIRGYNQTLASAYEALTSLVGQMRNAATAEDIDLKDVETFFKFGFTSVGRLQMLGRANPQASKLIREVIMPTWSTLDLTDRKGPHYRAYMLAMAQHLGVKVHKDKPDVAIGKVEALLTGKLAPIVEMLDEWHNSLEDKDPLVLEPSDMDTIRAALGKDHSFAAVHALIDYARYQTAVATRNADSFETALYLEADGVTDGPINALMNFVSGGFTTAWLDLMNRGGFYLGSKVTSLADFIAADPKNNQEDLYQKTVNRLRERLGNFAGTLAGNSRATAMNDALLGLMSDLLPELITFNPETRELTLDRGITKNPLTVTVYGSGAKGIANKITGQILDALYERLSKGDLTPAQQRSLKMLTQQVVIRDYGKYVVGLPMDKAGKPVPSNLNTGQGVDYKLTTYMIQNLQTNVLELFARELQGSIKDLMGDALVTSDLVRKATQVQSISLKYAFEEAVKKAVAAKDTNSTDDSKARDFLSKVELDTILKDLLKTHPMIDTGTQIIFVGGSAQSDMKINPFGSDLTEEIMVTPGYTWGPENAKVSGIPYLVIATGDGQMILNAMTMEAAPDNVLPVYDGINMPLDNITGDSQKINEAVMQGWLANPIRALTNSFKIFADNSGNMILSDKALEELGKAFDFTKGLKPDEIPEKIQDVLEALTSTADSIDARKAVMARVNVSVDHMASAGAPYVKTDGEELPTDPAAAVARLNEMLAEEEAKLKPVVKAQTTTDETPIAQGMIDTFGKLDPSGARVIETNELYGVGGNSGFAAGEQELFLTAVNSARVRGWKVVAGTPTQITQYARENGLSDPALAGAEGLAVPADRIVYLTNNSIETLTHELIHASTIEVLHAYYTNASSVAEATGAAIQRTEALLAQFMEIAPESIEDADVRAEFEFTIEKIEEAGLGGRNEAVTKAARLSEFMAYVLSNQKLIALTEAKPVTKRLAKITQAALKAISDFLYQVLGKTPTNMLETLRLNTQVIMASKPKALGDIRDLAPLAQFTSTSANYGNSDRLVNLELSFLDRLRGSIAQANAISPDAGFQVKLKHKEYAAATARVTQAFHHAFGMTQQEASLFGTFLVTFGMDAELDGNAQARLNDMFQHVMNKLDYTDFMADKTSQDQNDLSQAQAKFNLVTGNRMLKNDPEGRSTLLPAFLALANVSEEFRTILSKMDVPKNIASKGSTLDETLSNLGSDGIDRLARKLSGEGLKTTDLRSALELITNRIAESQTDRELYIEQFVTPVGNGVDKANQWIVDAMTKLSTKAYDALDEIKDNSNNRGVQLLAQAGQAVAGIFNEEIGAGQATFTMSLLDKAKIWVPVRELFSEVIGRTRENAPIYDMIKLSRAFIAQLRQRFREDLPKTINEKFTRALSAVEKTVLHSGLLKTDLATLSQLGNNIKVLGILKDHSKLVAEIAQLEREIDNLDPKYAAQLKTKSKELAEFMSTSKVPGLLLRNAEAVANLFQVIPVRARTGRRVSPKLISTIDKLTSLYALDMLSAAEAKVLSDLAANESVGVSFTLDYLRHLREDEYAKLSTDRARLNHYKGRSPVEAKSGASLIVADDREYSKLAARGYVRTGTYQRSRAEGNGPGMGYYLAPVTGKARFNQGIAQNVRQSLFGVDPVTGFSFNMHNVGRITDQRQVAAITTRLSLNTTQSAQGTPLMPILDAAGDIVAYERSLAPTQLAALQYETDLPNVLGMWKGRQVEEGAAVQLNHELIGKLHDIWDKREVGREDEFVDLLEPKNHGDPVVADAVALLTPQMRQQIEDAFGDRFMVRKSMINDVIGYRASSIGDFWTGTTRLKEDTAKGAADIATLVFGKKAYQYAVTGEKLWQNFISDARTTIVVRSVIVPVGNMISNVAQLVSRGVPLKTIITLMPKILSEVNSYHANKKMAVKLEAEIAAAGANTTKAKALKARLQALDDTNRRLSIWPVIQFGELSAISDATVVSEQTSLFEGNLVGYAEQLADKLPPSVRTAGRYAIISKDTALFQGLQKAVEYGDFLAKAVMYADLTKRQGKTGEEARVIISDEFVNYDRLPGRFRGMLEANGLLWFWHFKLRAIKVALSMARNNPLHALMGGLIPTPEFLGPVGSMFSDNALGVAYEGKLHYSTGVLQGIHAHSLNPWVNLVS